MLNIIYCWQFAKKLLPISTHIRDYKHEYNIWHPKLGSVEEWVMVFNVWLMCLLYSRPVTLRWRHNGRDSVSNHQSHGCLLNRVFRRRSKKTSKLCVTSLCVGNSPGTGEFPAQMASNAENVFIWWRHHEKMSAFLSTIYLSITHCCLACHMASKLAQYWLM